MLNNFKRTVGDQREIAGVCGGLAKALDISPGLVRVLALGGLFVSFGLMLLVYGVLALSIEDEAGN